MSYHSTSGMAASSVDMLGRLKAFLVTTCGWTLHDDQMALAQPYFVAASHGESGKEDIYLQFIKDANANMISVHGSLYWDLVSHVAVKDTFANGSTAFMTKDSTSFLYWIYADLDHVFIVTKIVATYYGHYSGIIRRFWSDRIAVTQGSVSAGSNVAAQVDDASIFTEGSYYIIKDNANIERARITTVNTASTPNTVTFATLVKGYSAGAKIGEDPQPVIVGRTANPGQFFALNKFDGYANTNGHSGSSSSFSSLPVYTDPDVRYGLIAMFPWFACMVGIGYEEFRGELIDVYCIGSGAGASEDVIDLGTSTYKMFNLDTANWVAVKE